VNSLVPEITNMSIQVYAMTNDGEHMSGVERFRKLYGKCMYGDTARPVNKCGVVGSRTQVR
jgi:hypothetical protein